MYVMLCLNCLCNIHIYTIIKSTNDILIIKLLNDSLK